MTKQTRLFLLLAAASLTLPAAPIRTLPGLTGINFFEGTSGVTTISYAPSATAMQGRLSGSLGIANNDFTGAGNEFYDVFYSNADGSFNLDGDYISIEAAYAGSSSGLNIMEVELLFGSTVVTANNVLSYAGFGATFNAASVGNAVDGNYSTGTSMGSTTGDQRLRVTVGFPAQSPSSEVPEPSSMALAALGLGAALGYRRYKQ